MLVRMAVLKGKDPQQLLEEMEVIDKQGIILLCFHLCQCRHLLSCEHITPILRELHWLPVQHHIELKLT